MSIINMLETFDDGFEYVGLLGTTLRTYENYVNNIKNI
jgi:hypothetical protein